VNATERRDIIMMIQAAGQEKLTLVLLNKDKQTRAKHHFVYHVYRDHEPGRNTLNFPFCLDTFKSSYHLSTPTKTYRYMK
jgi:hypothetical protein